MSVVDRWLMPDGIEELLPDEAYQIECIRGALFELYDSWGYDLVITPLIEYLDSLTVGVGGDLESHTFRLVDQASGRTLGVRPDITPQVARIDAHSLAMNLAYPGVRKKMRHRKSSQCDNNLRINSLDLAFQISSTG